MRLWKRAAVLCLCLCLLAGCAGSGEGLTLSVCVGDGVGSLDPIYTGEVQDQTVLAHLYENLMRVASDGAGGSAVVNGMAKSAESEEHADGTVTYTFRLRSAKWSDGREVQAGDFVYAWRRLVDPSSHSPYAPLLSMVCGYEEARSAGDMELLQVTAKNDTTLEVTLDGVYDWFLTQVCTSPVTMPLRQDVVQRLKEDRGERASWWSDPTALVTNGPFAVTGYEAGKSLTLGASERYYTELPGPQSLVFRFAGTAEEAQDLYGKKEVDAVWPPTEEQLVELASSEDWSPIPDLCVYTALYNCKAEPFSDGALRRAMDLAIDRGALAEAVGAAVLPAEGFVPPGVPENEEGDFRTTGGALLDNNPETYEDRRLQARALLDEAGYDSAAELGELEFLYVDEGANARAAEALCGQWSEVLGARVAPRAVTEQELWSALRSGSFTLAGVHEEAAGNDAEFFLRKWVSGSADNAAGYENTAYDALLSIVAGAPDGTARMGCLHDAEALLLSDCAISPLYTQGTAWQLRETLTGAFRDPRGWFGFAGVTVRAT